MNASRASAASISCITTPASPRRSPDNLGSRSRPGLKCCWISTCSGVVLGCYLAVEYPLMREYGGVIINTASMAGVYPIPGDPVYAAAKAGVIHLTHSLAYWVHSAASGPLRLSRNRRHAPGPPAVPRRKESGPHSAGAAEPD